MEEKKYIIAIGDFTAEETVYPNRCLSASFGGSGIESETIPWENEEKEVLHNPWDYKYENGEFVLDPIEISEPTIEPTQMDRMEAQLLYTALITNSLLSEV